MAAADAATVERSISAKVPCSLGARLSFSWGLGTELRFCEVQNPGSGVGGVEPYKSSVIWSAPSASHKTLAHAVSQSQDELVHATDNDRMDLPQEAVPPQLVAFSRRVREALARERATGDAGSLVALEHAVWQLLEVFFVDAVMSEGYVAEDMCGWLADNGDVLDEMIGRESVAARLHFLLSSQRPDVLDDYWPCMRALVLTGRSRDALMLLDAHDAMAGGGGGAPLHDSMLPQYELLDALYVLLRQMPRFRSGAPDGSTQGASGASGREFDNMAEFLNYRAQWAAQVRGLPRSAAELFSAAAAVNTASADGVASVLAILGGDDEGVLLDASANWLELLVAQLVHVRPSCQARQHLRPLLRHVREQLPDDGGGGSGAAVLPLLGDLLEATIDLEVQRVVEVLSSSGAVSAWFMAHMYEVLRAAPRTCGTIERPLPLFGGDQVEYWRLLFAEMLAATPSTTKLAVRYLSWCPTYGADAAEALLEAQPLGSDTPAGYKQVDKLLQLAGDHGLASSATVLCRSAGASAWSRGQLGEAAGWLLRARDERRLAVCLEAVVEELGSLLSSAVGTYRAAALPLAAAEQLEALVASLTPPASTRGGVSGPAHASVQLLGGFLALARAARAVAAAAERADTGSAAAPGEEAAAAAPVRDAAMALVAGGCVPRGMRAPLLFHLLPALEARATAFGVGDCQVLTRWLTDVELARQAGAAEMGLHPRHVKDVRLALARASARAHMYAAAAAGEARVAGWS
ncbi:hypothetical protein FOA52_003019 [Chlamydomonas sp. UWO 241]|nr:hypothetical protein FOA52_003019 [Chlamydomonas sp. UWO 241]